MTTKSCATCKLFELEWDGSGDHDCAFGYCGWKPAMPWAWRYARREVMGVHPDEGTECPAHEPKEIT